VVDETAASWIRVASLECRTAGEFAGTLFDHSGASTSRSCSTRE
jgi:hypothetical protein